MYVHCTWKSDSREGATHIVISQEPDTTPVLLPQNLSQSQKYCGTVGRCCCHYCRTSLIPIMQISILQPECRYGDSVSYSFVDYSVLSLVPYCTFRTLSRAEVCKNKKFKHLNIQDDDIACASTCQCQLRAWVHQEIIFLDKNTLYIVLKKFLGRYKANMSIPLRANLKHRKCL